MIIVARIIAFLLLILMTWGAASWALFMGLEAHTMALAVGWFWAAPIWVFGACSTVVAFTLGCLSLGALFGRVDKF